MRSPFEPMFGLRGQGVCFKSGSNPGGNGNGTSTVTNQVQLPQWVSQAGQNNYNQAQNVAQNMMAPYTGQRVAELQAPELATIGALQDNVGSTNAAFASAQNTAANVANYQPGQVNAGFLSGTDLSPYMNPFTQNVVNSGLQALDIQRQQANNQGDASASTSGAFGGSRQGVQTGVTNAGAAMQAGSLASNLQMQNFQQAQAAATGDLNRSLQAQTTNQSAGLQGAGLNLSAANSLGNLAAQGQNSFLQGAQASIQGQTLIQQQQQAQLDAARQAYSEQQQFPLQQLQVPLQALGMTPYGQTTTSTSPVPQGNGAMQTAGTAATGLGLLGQLGTAGAAIFAASDRRLKTDIKKLGKDPGTGFDLYAYRYKGDPKSYPKVVGPMAQDIEKKFPGQVSEVGGRKIINLGFGGPG